MVFAFEDLGDGREEEIQVAVDDGHEGGHGEDDGREDEHFGGADDGAFEEVGGREARVKFGAERGITRFQAEAPGFAFEEDGRVGFAEEEEGEDTDGAGLVRVGGSLVR